LIITKEKNYFIIKIIKERIKDYDCFNQEQTKKLFKRIIEKLKEKYNINGLLDINVYINKIYGMIIEIEKIYSYPNEIDMHIHFHIDAIFMNEINELDIKNQNEVYYYSGKYYSMYNHITDSNIIYKIDDILEKGIRIS